MASVKIDLTGKFGDKSLSSKSNIQFEGPLTILDVIHKVNAEFGIEITPRCLQARDIICVYNDNAIEPEFLNQKVFDGDSITFFQPLAGA